MGIYRRFISSLAFLMILIILSAASYPYYGNYYSAFADLPTVTIKSPSDGTLLNKSTFTISGTSTHDKGPKITSVGVSIDNGPSSAASGTDSWTYTMTRALSDGRHTITATASAGSHGSSSASVSVTVDTTAPTKPIISSPSSGTSTTDTTPTFSGTAEASSTVRVYDGSNTTPIATTTASSTGTWSATPSTALSIATHSITAKATDAAGNTSPSSVAVSVTILSSSSIQFSTSKNIAREKVDAPQIISVGSNVYILWKDYRNNNIAQTYFTRSIDNGVTFGPEINLSNSVATSTSAHMAVSGNNVYVVWLDLSTGDNEIFLRKSTDNGSTFSTPVNISQTPATASLDPKVAVSGSRVYVVWTENTAIDNSEIYLRRSTDSGATFGSTINVSNTKGLSSFPDISAAGSYFYVAWADRPYSTATITYEDVWFRRSTDGGATLSSSVQLSATSGPSGTSLGKGQTKIALSGSNVYVLWGERASSFSTTEVYLIRSTDNGATFAAPVNLSNNTLESQNPQIAVSGTNVYVAWNDESNTVQFRKSGNSGSTFSTTTDLDGGLATSYDVQMAAAGSNVYLLWRSPNPLYTDVYFRMSADSGATFGSTINVSNTLYDSYVPTIAASGTYAHVLWRDPTASVGILYRAGD